MRLVQRLRKTVAKQLARQRQLPPHFFGSEEPKPEAAPLREAISTTAHGNRGCSNEVSDADPGRRGGRSRFEFHGLPVALHKSGAFAGGLLLIAFAVPFAPNATGADKSGVSPNAISLPKGPGSIEGLGESFQPTLNTGTAKYSIPLKLPPGTAGHNPSLSLHYEGGAANGPVGYGWEVPVGFVQRRSDRGIPTYGEDLGTGHQDTFIDESREELVPRTDGYYFCKNEGSFVRYRPVGAHWEATQADGGKLEFGLTSDGRIAEGGRVFSWLLERETDTHGNTIVYTYTSFTGLQNTNQKYLATITYGAGAPPWTNFHFVRFEYEDRPDWFEDCRSGFVVRTGKRLKTISVGTQGPTLTGHLAADFNQDGKTDNLDRKYHLEYVNYAGTNTHWSLLARVTLIGADGTTNLPPNTFGYLVCNPSNQISAAGKEINSANEPDYVMDNPLVDVVDLNGDALPDVLKTGEPAHRAWLNQGEASTNGQRVIRWKGPVEIAAGSGDAWTFNLDSPATHLADMDGDGLADLVHKATEENVFYFRNLGQAGWGERQSMAAVWPFPPAPFEDSYVRTADMDFDKRIDLVRADGTEYHIWFNLGQAGYSDRVTVSQTNNIDFSSSGVQVVDMNGDRVPDVARVWPNGLDVAAGLGYGRFAAMRFVALPGWTLDSEQVQKARLSDITGDGLPDLVLERAVPGELWFWMNLGNYTFSTRKVITGMPTGIGAAAAIRWADINGNGTTDLVYCDSASSPKIRAVDIGELLGCSPSPNTLVTITNGIGRITLIGYQPSTKFALEDAAAGRPWPDPMPFPVSVVATVTTSDSLGHSYLTQFGYHDGYYDPGEKQFRGFARAEQVDVGDATAPTLVTRSHFDTGREFRVMKGRLLRVTAEQEDGRIFTDETTQWVNPPVILMTGTNGEPVQYVHPVGSVKVIKELGLGTERKVESAFAYDRYGNETTNANYGIVVGSDRSAFNDERIAVTQYAINTNAWLLHAPCRHEIMDENGVVISRTESFYDDETFSMGNFGEVTRGDLTLTRAWIDPSKPENFVLSGRTKYDSYGNPEARLDPLAGAPAGVTDYARGHVNVVEFDPLFHTYPVTETVHVGDGKEALMFRAAYDYGFGTPTSSTDWNENTTTYAYDGLARLIRIARPGDLESYASAEYEYALGVGFGSAGLVNYIETRLLDRPPESPGDKRSHYFIARQYSDGLGRPLMTRTEAEPASPGGPPRVAVSGAVMFNARQKPALALNPFFAAAASTSLDELLAYEAVDSPGWTGLFQENGVLTPLDLAHADQTSTRYDATLRSIEVENADRTYARTAYEPLLTRTFDENDTDSASDCFNTPVIHFRDGLGRLIRTDEITRLNEDGTAGAEPQAWTTRYEYDLNGKLTRLIDSQNNVRWADYDGLKRKTYMNDPNRGEMHYRYDDASNLIETTDAKGQTVSFTYDGANRLRTEDYHDEGLPFSGNYVFNPNQPVSKANRPDVAYFYDTPVPGLDFGNGATGTARNVKGKLALVWDLAGEEHASFDARDRAEWTVKRIPDPVQSSGQAQGAGPGPVSYQTRFEFDSLDRLNRIVYPDNDEVRQEYNERSLLKAIVGGPRGSMLTNLSYWPSAQKKQMDYGNGVRSAFRHDSRLRLKTLTAVSTGSDLPRELMNFQYEFDGASNIRSIADLRPEATAPAGDTRRNTQFFRYDDRYRLTRVQFSFNLPGQAERNDGEVNYRYDRLGNMLAQTSTLDHEEKGLPVANLGTMVCGAGATTGRLGRQPADPPGPHALTSVQHPTLGARAYSYDANGNLATSDGLTNTWDFQDRLVAVESSDMRAEYTYDHTGNRTIKRVWHKNGTNSVLATTLYINKWFEVRDHDVPVKYVWNGKTRLARVTGSLNSRVRVQRLRVWTGWNLCSIAVTTTNVLTQAGGLVQSAYRWNDTASDWQEVSGTETLPAGTVLWLKAATNCTLAICGVFSETTNRTLPAGGHFISQSGFEAWCWTNSGFALQPAAFSLWSYNAGLSRWLSALPPPLRLLSDFSPFVSPGSALFVRADQPFQIETPDSALSIRYYHQDHLTSTSVQADSAGRIIAETAFYPFGETRHTASAQPADLCPSDYLFAQRERDSETGFDCFGARFLLASLGRFSRVDPASDNPPESALLNPQLLHAYAYAGNNPLKLCDPDGEFPGLATAAGAAAGFVVSATVHTFRTIFSKSYRESYGWNSESGHGWHNAGVFTLGLLKNGAMGALAGAAMGAIADTLGAAAIPAWAALLGDVGSGAAVGGASSALSQSIDILKDPSTKLFSKKGGGQILRAFGIGAVSGAVFGAVGYGLGAIPGVSGAGQGAMEFGSGITEETASTAKATEDYIGEHKGSFFGALWAPVSAVGWGIGAGAKWLWHKASPAAPQAGQEPESARGPPVKPPLTRAGSSYDLSAILHHGDSEE